MDLMNEDLVAGFWKWFGEHSSELSNIARVEKLMPELEARLFEICEVDWEIGPGREERHLFALSPRGQKDLLSVTRDLVRRAPRIAGWEFAPAKPPRDWQLIFTMEVGDKEVVIDGKSWQFVAYKFKDGTYDLLFKPGDGSELTEEYQYWAATIIVDGEIGEERRIDQLGVIEVVKCWDQKTQGAARALKCGILGQLLV